MVLVTGWDATPSTPSLPSPPSFTFYDINTDKEDVMLSIESNSRSSNFSLSLPVVFQLSSLVL